MPSGSFLIAREKGRPAQKILANYLRQFTEVEEVEDGFFQPYDLKLGSGKTIEVKRDLKSHLTGNLVLELEALDHSTADVLAICWGDPIRACYLLPMDKARAFAHSWQHKIRAGEFNGEMALIKRTLFFELLTPEIIEF